MRHPAPREKAKGFLGEIVFLLTLILLLVYVFKHHKEQLIKITIKDEKNHLGSVSFNDIFNICFIDRQRNEVSPILPTCSNPSKYIRDSA